MDERDDDWGPWVKHDGNGCPLEVMGKRIQVYWRPEIDDDENWRFADVICSDLFASCSTWHAARFEGKNVFQHWNGKFFEKGPYWVDRYRIYRPRALQQLIEIATHVPDAAPRELEDV